MTSPGGWSSRSSPSHTPRTTPATRRWSGSWTASRTSPGALRAERLVSAAKVGDGAPARVVHVVDVGCALFPRTGQSLHGRQHVGGRVDVHVQGARAGVAEMGNHLSRGAE